MSFILLFCKSSYSLARHQANLGLFTWPNPLKFSKLEEVILVEVQVFDHIPYTILTPEPKMALIWNLVHKLIKRNTTMSTTHDNKAMTEKYDTIIIYLVFQKKKRAKMLCFYVFHLKITKNENCKQNCEQIQKSWTQLILHLFKLHTISVAKLLFWNIADISTNLGP